MIREYKVLSAVYGKSLAAVDHDTVLEDDVNRHIEEGWQPHGSLVVASKGDTVVFFQPMVLPTRKGVSASVLRQGEE
jgi:hypothetical protein